MNSEEFVILGALGLGLYSVLTRNEHLQHAQHIVIPLHPYIDVEHGEKHITGIFYKIGPHSSVGLIDSRSSMPAISKETAKKIHFQDFPLTAPLHSEDSRHSSTDPGIRILPLEIPGLGIFPASFIVGYEFQPTLIPPDIFYKWYDVEFTSKYAMFKTKSHEPVIPYIRIEDLAASDQEIYKKGITMPGKKMPIIPFSVGNISFPFTLDTGWGELSTISKHTASILQIEQYPKKFKYDGDFTEVHRVPVQIGEFGSSADN